MVAEDWQLIGFTAWVAAASTALILPFGIFFGWLLARKQWRGKTIVETVLSLPLVMPPVATGLILLKIFGRRGAVGKLLHDAFGIDLVFTWKAVVIALAVMALPLLVRAARIAFEQIDPRLEQIARTLGAGEFRVFFTVSLPLSRRGVMGGVMLAFARALGEFGATIMVAGNIPGQTTTLSLAIYEAVQLAQDTRAVQLLAIAVAMAFAALWLSEFCFERKRDK